MVSDLNSLQRGLLDVILHTGRMSFDSDESSSEDEDILETPLNFNWVDLDKIGMGKDKMAISEMPGAKFKNIARRNLVKIRLNKRSNCSVPYI